MKIYVDINAPRDGNGSREAPFRHINDAAGIAVAGDEVLVMPGVYREYVNPRNAGTEEKRIIYRSLEPLRAIVTGAEEIKTWRPYQGGVWIARVNNGVFGAYNPYTTCVRGDWYFGPAIRHIGNVFLNDRMMYETATLEECILGERERTSWFPEESVYKWYTEQDGDETVLYANFQGKNPHEEKVEISVRRNCVMPDKTGVDCITLSGFKIDKAATTWAPPAAYQDGMVGPHWSRGWIIEDCEISNSKCGGISLGKYRDPENDMYFYTRHVKSPTQMERDAICRGQYHGWLKEKIGAHIIRRCHIHHCGQAGIVGRMGGVFSLIEDNHIHHICNSQQLAGAETAAIKIHAAIDVTIRRNHIHHSIMGVWCDWQAQGTRISQNLMHDNFMPEGSIKAKDSMFSQDIFVEVAHGPTLIDNNILLSKTSLCMAAQGIACVHNLMLGALTMVGGGTGARYTPYHIRHRTEVAGFMTILHGDDRFYNNIFVQHWPITNREAKPETSEHQAVGTGCFDDYPDYAEWIANFDMEKEPDMNKLEPFHNGRLPVWIDGNAYLGGATAYGREKHKLVNLDGPISVQLIEKDGKYTLRTNLYQYMKEFRGGVIHSDLLGYAFEPEQRFENADGSDIVFDRDYFGDHRGAEATPGPFADGEKDEYVVWGSIPA